MSWIRKNNDVEMGRCCKCDGDLEVRHIRKKKVALNFCTNPHCVFYSKSHPTGSLVNKGKA